jgi:type I restriction enzyme S subunit
VKHLAWTSDLPNGWAAKPLRALAEYWVSSVDKIPAEDETPVRLCNYSEVYKNEFVTLGLDFMHGTATVEEIRKFRLAVGDVVITKDSESWDDIAVPALICESAEDLVCGYHLALIRPNFNRVLGRFLFRCLQAKPVRTQLELAASDGVTRFGVPKSEIGGAWVPVPPYNQQHAIADYLDRETARLDALIAAKERLLGLLAEKRQALITRAVTRGLDPNAPLRDSGIPWLGQIPAHWEVWRLKHVCEIGNGSTPRRDHVEYWFEGTIPWVTSAAANTDEIVEAEEFVTPLAKVECHLPTVRAGSVLVGIIGQGKTRGKASLLRFDATLSQNIAFLTPQPSHATGEYLHLVVSCMYDHLRGISQGAGGAQGSLTCEMLGAERVPLPPPAEQIEIVNTLRRRLARLVELRDTTVESISFLKERRTALIAAAVTGQIPIPSEAVA